MAKEKATVRVKILSEDSNIYSGNCQVLFVPYQKDEIAILPMHTPIIALLSSGKLRIIDNTGTKTVAEINSGVLYVAENEVTVLVNT